MSFRQQSSSAASHLRIAVLAATIVITLAIIAACSSRPEQPQAVAPQSTLANIEVAVALSGIVVFDRSTGDLWGYSESGGQWTADHLGRLVKPGEPLVPAGQQ